MLVSAETVSQYVAPTSSKDLTTMIFLSPFFPNFLLRYVFYTYVRIIYEPSMPRQNLAVSVHVLPFRRPKMPQGAEAQESLVQESGTARIDS